MAFPQPSADQYVTDGYSYFRLRTPIASAGDMYESTQSGFAIALGPDSDIANVKIAYYDTQAVSLFGVETFMSTALISPERAYVGKTDAHNEQSALYMPSKRPGRILIFPLDLYDPGYLPAGFNPHQDFVIFETPTLDVMQFFAPQDGVTGARADKTFFYQTLPFGLRDVYVLVPCYGRKYIFTEFNLGATSASSIDVTIVGLQFTVSPNGPLLTTLQAAATQAVGAAPKINTFTAGTEGEFDYLQFQFHPNGAGPYDTTLKIILSDVTVGA